MILCDSRRGSQHGPQYKPKTTTIPMRTARTTSVHTSDIFQNVELMAALIALWMSWRKNSRGSIRWPLGNGRELPAVSHRKANYSIRGIIVWAPVLGA